MMTSQALRWSLRIGSAITLMIVSVFMIWFRLFEMLDK